MHRMVAFLRGINVGGNKKIEMARLREEFLSWGYSEVSTLLNSGNVVFGSKKTGDARLAKEIEANIKKSFGFEVPTIVRSVDELAKLAAKNPFAKVKVTKDTRLYVTFLKEEPRVAELPKPDKSFKIISTTSTELFSVVNLGAGATVDAMFVLERLYGKGITTRNWNTVLRILKVAESK